jgi:hypothetical protein
MQALSRVKCVKSEDGSMLVEDAIYTVYEVTRKGHLRLFEINPPSPYNCFAKYRFIDTGEKETNPPDWNPIGTYWDIYSSEDLRDLDHLIL